MKDIETYKAKCMVVLSRHGGEEKAIGMDVLYKAVFGGTVRHKINDTRPLRTVITVLRDEGAAIGSVRRKNGGGYYLARGSELVDYKNREKQSALKKLARLAKMEDVSLPQLLGQMKLNLEGEVSV